jgi:non-homologous end joining protein Ku
MSRRTKYTVKLGKGGLQFKIAIAKSYDEKTGFTQTYPDPDDPTEIRCVRTIKVLTTEGLRPADVSDIRMIVPWTEVQSSFTYRDDEGVERLLPLDEELIGKIYTASEFMSSLGFIDSAELHPCDFEGSHYFVTVQKDSKSKTPDPNDVKAYSTIYYTCEKLRQTLIVKFVSGEREKAAAIYAHNGCLMISTLIHTNYQRKPPSVEQEELPAHIEILAKKLVAANKLNSLPEDELCDKYEERVLEYLQKAKEQVRATGAIIKISMKPAPRKNDDFFSMLEGL